MNTPNTAMLKIGVWLQTMTLPVYVYTGPTLPDAFSRLLKKIQTASPFESLNKERLAMGYAPLTNSEWLAYRAVERGDPEVDDLLLRSNYNNEDEEIFDNMGPIYSHEISNIYYGNDDS